MKYYVDGYNLLFRLLSKKNSLEVSRTQVIASINEMALHLKLNIILVFDATQQKERLGVARGHFDALEVVYTEYKNADDFILGEVENARSPSQITVVSSDRELCGRVRQLGAKTQSIGDFANWLRHKRQKRNRLAAKPQVFRDSDSHISRLLKIFEEKLKDEEK
jgi:predicted RNA-binding protein with PIN domain